MNVNWTSPRMVAAIAIAGLVVAAGTCTATPVVLNCVTDTGVQMADLKLDMDKRTMTSGGGFHLQIQGLTNCYITGVLGPSEFWEKVGGEIWVIDRLSGDFQRVSLTFEGRGVNGTLMPPPALAADIYRGRCTRPL